MPCPHCASNDVVETSKFDLTLVSVDEARHDFECEDCGCLFQIIYHPIETRIIPKDEE